MTLSRDVTLETTRDEIDLHKQDRQLRVFSSTPDKKLLQDREVCVIDNGSSVHFAIRIGSTVKTVELT